jgi:hypothetical protein
MSNVTLPRKVLELLPDPEDSWALVELYRWQYGELPGANEKPLDEAEGLRGMAEAIERGDPKNFPAPFNVVSVLRYAAKRLDEMNRASRAERDARQSREGSGDFTGGKS